MTTTNRPATALTLWAILWALAIVASGFVFKDSTKEWIELVLLVVAISGWLWLWESRRQPRLNG
jgi:hypothetical protein